MQKMPLLAGSARACTAAAGKAANQELAYYKDTSLAQLFTPLQAAAIAAHTSALGMLIASLDCSFRSLALLASLLSPTLPASEGSVIAPLCHPNR